MCRGSSSYRVQELPLAGFCLSRSIEWICSVAVAPTCLLGTSFPRTADGIVEPRRQPGHTLLSRRNRDEALTAASTVRSMQSQSVTMDDPGRPHGLWKRRLLVYRAWPSEELRSRGFLFRSVCASEVIKLGSWVLILGGPSCLSRSTPTSQREGTEGWNTFSRRHTACACTNSLAQRPASR